MARSGAPAAVPTTLPPPPAQPSIFDVLAAESLLASARPAVRRLLRHVAALDGGGAGRFRWLRRWEDEVMLVLELLVQTRFLRLHGASFAENFYGIRRREGARSGGSAASGGSGASGGASFLLKALLVVVVVPYLRKKLAEFHENCVRLEAEGNLPKKYEKVMKAFIAVYPLASTCLQSTTLLYQLLFAFGRITFHDPLEHLLGLRYELTPREESLVVVPSVSSSTTTTPSTLKSTLDGMLRMSGRLASHAFSVGLFLLQFVDVFNVEGGAAGAGVGFDASLFERLKSVAPPSMTLPNGILDALRPEAASRPPTGPSPPPSPSSQQQQQLQQQHHLCPICRSPRRNETALSVSGFVFCYRCISSYLKTHGVCPVTKIPAKTQNLVRLFPAQG